MNPPAGNFAEAMNAYAELQNFVAGYLEILVRKFRQAVPDGTFDPRDESVLGESRRQAVYRNALRLSRTGEIRLVSESRSLALPFNFKRWVCDDGIHTASFDGRRSRRSDANSQYGN